MISLDVKPLLGCHVSAAGGLHRVFERGDSLGCTAIQLFTRNQRRWDAPHLAVYEADRFRTASREHPAIRMVLAHGSYLLNLAADPREREEISRRSAETLLDELNRCAALGIPYLIVHPGAHGGQGEHRGIENALSRVNEVLHRFEGDTMLLVETTAGQGTGIGYRFEHIRDLIAGAERVGACMDTCHIFCAGYDIRTQRQYRRTIREFDRLVGIERLKALHLNDSRDALGSRIDRHAHIGRGEIGIRGFSHFMVDERLASIPKILETPKRMDGRDMDRENLELLRRLAGGNR
jgi:deoxyribonuclease-4